MLAALATLLFCLLMTTAVASDIRTMTIPNWISGALVGAFALAAAGGAVSPADLATHLVTGGLVLLAVVFLFAAGWMGGGDAKLIAVTALWFGPSLSLADYALLASLVGGVLTLLVLGARQVRQADTGVVFVDRLLDRSSGVPYGVALGLAAIVVELANAAAGTRFA